MFGKKKKPELKPISLLQYCGKTPAEAVQLKVCRENYTKLANEILVRAQTFDQLAKCAPLCMDKKEVAMLQKTAATILSEIQKMFLQRVK